MQKIAIDIYERRAGVERMMSLSVNEICEVVSELAKIAPYDYVEKCAPLLVGPYLNTVHDMLTREYLVKPCLHLAQCVTALFVASIRVTYSTTALFSTSCAIARVQSAGFRVDMAAERVCKCTGHATIYDYEYELMNTVSVPNVRSYVNFIIRNQQAVSGVRIDWFIRASNGEVGVQASTLCYDCVVDTFLA